MVVVAGSGLATHEVERRYATNRFALAIPAPKGRPTSVCSLREQPWSVVRFSRSAVSRSFAAVPGIHTTGNNNGACDCKNDPQGIERQASVGFGQQSEIGTLDGKAPERAEMKEETRAVLDVTSCDHGKAVAPVISVERPVSKVTDRSPRRNISRGFVKRPVDEPQSPEKCGCQCDGDSDSAPLFAHASVR